MKTTRKELQEEFDRQKQIVEEKSKEWKARWDGISCPFMKVKDMNSPNFVKDREAVLTPWRKAKSRLQKFILSNQMSKKGGEE
jgi:hypothetical protein